MNFYEQEPVSLYLDDLNEIEHIVSSKQEIIMYEHPFLGKILVINGEIQHIEHYQCPYHESLVHIPASFIPKINTALIIGGGSLFAANELLKYPSINSLTLCDYDSTVLQLMEKYYLHAKNVINNPKFNYVENEGIAFISNCNKKYDLIINDCFNLLEIGRKNNFSLYSKLASMLTPNGVCSDVIYRHIFDDSVTHDSIEEIKRNGNVALSLVTVPEYPGILHVQTMWGNSPYLSQNRKKSVNLYHNRVMAEELHSFNFFCPENLSFYLYLPPYIKSKL